MALAPYSPVADWQVRQTGDHQGNFYDSVSGASATVTRTTPKTIYDPLTGRIHDVPAGILAVNPWAAYQTNGRGLAVVVEGARANAFLRSYVIDATALAAWTADAGLTAALGGAAHGLYDAAKGAVLSADGSNRGFWQQITATATAWVVSCYVRKADLSAVTVDDMQLCAKAGTATPVGTLLTTAFAALTNGWYRATATFTGTAAAWAAGVAVKAGKAITVDCLDVGAGAFATSYIPTTSAPVNRNGDQLTVPTSAWDASKGTVVVVAAQPLPGASPAYQWSWAKDANDRMQVYTSGGNGNPAFLVRAGGVTNDTVAITRATTVPFVATARWATDAKAALFLNGAGKVESAANHTAPTGLAATATVGYYGEGTGPLSRLVIYNAALTDTEISSPALSTDLLNGPRSSMMAKLLAIGVL